MSDLSIDFYSKRFAARMATMVSSRLIEYQQYYAWADRWIAVLKEPPIWLLEIATLRNSEEAALAIKRFVLKEPFEHLERDQQVEEFIACLFLRYQNSSLTWGEFLSRSGAYVDGYGGRRGCDYFFGLLNDFEDAACSRELEMRQQSEVKNELRVALSNIQPLFEMFSKY